MLPKSPTPPIGTTLFAYKHPATKSLVTTLKYKGDRTIAHFFAWCLIDHIHHIRSEANLFNEPVYIVPIPRSKNRIREFGFCQTDLIARELIKLDPTLQIRNILYKKDIPAQTSLSRAKRLENVRDAFWIADPASISGKSIILLDDVITTGATLKEARQKLKAFGGHVVECLAVGH